MIKIAREAKEAFSTILDSFRLYDREPEEIVTENDIDDMYKSRRSFTDKLPWLEYLKEDECFLLEDEKSVAAAYDLIPVNGEGVQLKELARIRDNFQQFVNDVFPAHDNNPWVVEFYQSDILSLEHFSKKIREYIHKVGSPNPLTDKYIPVVEQHLRDVCKEGGLFFDEAVTGVDWRGAIRVYRLIFYRRYGNRGVPPKGKTPIQELNEIKQTVESNLSKSGIKFSLVDGKAFYTWMFRWFNPRPKITNGDSEELLSRLPYVDNEDLPYGHDFAESLFYSPPTSDYENGVWRFDDLPHKIINVSHLRRRPEIGATSAPKSRGKSVSSLFDRMPEGTVMSMKVIVIPNEQVESQIQRIEQKAIGESSKIERVQEEVERAKKKLAYDERMYPVELAFYIRGNTDEHLRQNQVDVVSLLQQSGLNPIDDDVDPLILDSYIINLPMAYDPSRQKARRRSRLIFTQHIANLAPIMGRGRGTGNPGMLWFNRGGEPMTFDPLNKFDRAKNGHMVLFGPTGAGKSASLTAILLYMIAVYNARVFLVESGNSFALLREYISDAGLSTHRVRMSASEDTVVPPFANALKALTVEETNLTLYGRSAVASNVDVVEQVIEDFSLGKLSPDYEEEEEEEEDAVEEKDYLGEMEIIARIMISGGNKEVAKGIRLGDQQLLREAILDAARSCRSAGRTQVITGDVAEQLSIISQREDVPREIRTRFFEYAAAMRRFTQGLSGKIFNREGVLFPECDFTHIDLAEFTKDNMEAELAVAFMACLNTAHDIAERDQELNRPLIFLGDESHLFTKNPLLSPGIVKIVKMWRKLGAWLWLATQNMADFPDEAEVMLSLFEWWICLNLEESEVEEVGRFKKLSDEQKFLLTSARKQPGCYTEGVVLSSRLTELFRSVPPSITLALAMTESHEKAQRRQIMDEYGCSRLEAVGIVSEQIDKSRGIIRQ
ncbi:conjugative transfer ATPase [Shewanella bicestrii]